MFVPSHQGYMAAGVSGSKMFCTKVSTMLVTMDRQSIFSTRLRPGNVLEAGVKEQVDTNNDDVAMQNSGKSDVAVGF